jgi:hypothetical protein
MVAISTSADITYGLPGCTCRGAPLSPCGFRQESDPTIGVNRQVCFGLKLPLCGSMVLPWAMRRGVRGYFCPSRFHERNAALFRQHRHPSKFRQDRSLKTVTGTSSSRIWTSTTQEVQELGKQRVPVAGAAEMRASFSARTVISRWIRDHPCVRKYLSSISRSPIWKAHSVKIRASKCGTMTTTCPTTPPPRSPPSTCQRHRVGPLHVAAATSGVHPFPQRPRASRVDRLTHAIPENYAADKASQGQLGRPPGRWVFFIPTSASGLNAVEGFPSTLTRRCPKRRVFKASPICKVRYLREHNIHASTTMRPSPSSGPHRRHHTRRNQPRIWIFRLR